MKIETVSIIYKHPKILLGMKKVRFGKGKYNGFGGGVEKYETIKESAIRETFDESEITMLNPLKKGIILFHFQSKEDDHEVHFFKADKIEGTPKETEEMKPKWFQINQIPYDLMWPDDKYWLPLLLEDKCFKGNFEFDLEGKIAKYELNEVQILD